MCANSEGFDEMHFPVVLNHKTSDWKLVQAGVSQGSILGTLWFLLYKKYMVQNIGCSLRLFAGYMVVECQNTSVLFWTPTSILFSNGPVIGTSLLTPVNSHYEFIDGNISSTTTTIFHLLINKIWMEQCSRRQQVTSIPV